MTSFGQALSTVDAEMILRTFRVIIIALGFLPLALPFVGAAPQPQTIRQVRSPQANNWPAFSKSFTAQTTPAQTETSPEKTTDRTRRRHASDEPISWSGFTIFSIFAPRPAGRHALA